ncbi:MAG TPA: hypothetical protein VLE72_01440 [Candidatus Saccharimonadales bacterium]|nr:hypothetical protein [Candidatus Saccharimonadales bacterium]
MSSRRHLQEIIKNLQEYYKCPSCNTNYHFDDIKFLGQIDVYCFVQLTCHSCSLPVVATVSVGDEAKPRKSKAKSDLKRVEEAKFGGLGPISSDEIASFHTFIQSHQGGFTKLN